MNGRIRDSIHKSQAAEGQSSIASFTVVCRVFFFFLFFFLPDSVNKTMSFIWFSSNIEPVMVSVMVLGDVFNALKNGFSLAAYRYESDMNGNAHKYFSVYRCNNNYFPVLFGSLSWS